MISATPIADKRAELWEKADAMQALIDAAEEQQRDLTPPEQREWDTLKAQANGLRREIELGGVTGLPNDVPSIVSGRTTESRSPGIPATVPERWEDSDGRPVHVLAKGQRVTDLYPQSQSGITNADLNVGRYVRACITGQWQKHAPNEHRLLNEMGTNSNAGGAYLVPEQLAAQMIDLARSKTSVFEAGARVMPMGSDRMEIARLTGDPTLAFKGENNAFSDSDASFDRLGFTAHTYGAVVKSSRELAEDAPNFTEIISSSLSSALAVGWDGLALNGTGSAEIEGLKVKQNLNELTSVGAIAFEDFLDAITECRKDNHEPNAYMLSPEINNDLAKLVTGDGTNSAKNWLGAPEDVAALQRHVTTQVADTDAFVGDFTQMLFGVRSEMRIEVSTEAGDAFAKHQLWIKLVVRFDVQLEHSNAFCRLLGITT